MWSKVLISFVLGVLASACGSESVGMKYPKPLAPALVMHGDVSFTEDERSQIEDAATTWREQTNGQANLKIVWDWSPDTTIKDGDHHIVRLTNGSLEVIVTDCEMSDECKPSVLAWVTPAGGIHNPEKEPVDMAFIPERYPDGGSFKSVALHEMGHVFGLPHEMGRQAVMYPSQNAVKTCLKPSDLASFCQYNSCDSRRLYPCE